MRKSKLKERKREKSAQERKQGKRTDASFLKEKVRRAMLDGVDGCMQLHIARVCVHERKVSVIPSLGARVDMRVAVWRYHF